MKTFLNNNREISNECVPYIIAEVGLSHEGSLGIAKSMIDKIAKCKVNAVKFLNDLGNPYDYLTKDSLGKNSVNFGIYGIPESILIDSQFKIIKKIIGPLNNKELDEIREIIKS